MHLKRILDLMAASVCVPLVAPFALLIAIAVKVDSSGPMLFIQDRLGKNQKKFRCLKFRTMHHGVAGSAWTVEDDPRVTRIGRVLRAVHLDELPQLVNVLRGEMSIVGPRPLVEEEAILFGATRYPYSRRFSVLPGITGLAQVSVPPDAHLAKFALDAFYVKRWSLQLDLMILAFTVQKFFWRKIRPLHRREREMAERVRA